MDRLRGQHYELAYHDAGIGSPAIVLVHDLGADHRSLLPLFSLLNARHRTVAYDLAGYGASTGHADHVGQLLWLRRELGLGRILIVGHRAGAEIAAEAALADPRRMFGIVRLDPLTPPVDSVVPLVDLTNGDADLLCRAILVFVARVQG